MIVKMKFLSITGPRTDIDRVTNLYLSKYEMQLENALTELKTVDNLLPFLEVNPYKDPLAKVKQFLSYLPELETEPSFTLEEHEMMEMIRSVNHDYMEFQESKEGLKKKREELAERMRAVEPFAPLDFELHDILQFKYIKFRFGRISVDYYHRLERSLLGDIDAVFVEGARDENYVYGIYFVSDAESGKIDSMMKSLHFERINLTEDFGGTPLEAYRKLEKDVSDINDDINKIKQKRQQMFREHASDLLGAQITLDRLSKNFDIRKYAARTEEEKEDYYILCGWMAEDDVKAFIEEAKNDPRIYIVVEEDKEQFFGEPPTKLKNPKLFKPFEMFTKMYGLPKSGEMDPTVFVGLTYTFIFGAMFGDVGQGLLLFIGGGLIYLKKKANLAGIISLAGVFSTFFGFMFGSIFGFEDIIEARWIRPIEHMTNLPFIGKLNTVFIVSIGFGMLIIIISMILHIVNALRAHDTENVWFDANGLAGLIFYSAVVAVVALFMTGHAMPGGIVMLIMFGVPLLLIALKEPLTRKITKSAKKMEESKAMFVTQAFFELFETLLSYFSNTLSFIRIGAFAVSHASIMQVVLMLAGAETGKINWAVMILGNIFVCGFEGLIVGIQVLRLEYYEMFSRFYKGSGREFKKTI